MQERGKQIFKNAHLPFVAAFAVAGCSSANDAEFRTDVSSTTQNHSDHNIVTVLSILLTILFVAFIM